jgi:quinol monooxygenase YgiN
MLVLLVELRIRAERVDDFRAAIQDNARASLEHELGCRRFDVCEDPADVQRFVLYELYDDEAAVQAHLRSPHFLAMDAATRDWVLAKTVQRLVLLPPRMKARLA